MVGFSSSSVLGLLGTNFVNFLIPISFLFIRSQPKFESCTTASLNQRAAVVHTGATGSVSPSLSVRFTELKPIQVRHQSGGYSQALTKLQPAQARANPVKS